MTTPIAAMPVIAPLGTANAGNVSGSLISGASGSLGGTNMLQSSIDSLTAAVNSLTTAMAANTNASGQGGMGGSSMTRQQNVSGAGSFPAANQSQFTNSNNSGGNGGGGQGGSGFFNSKAVTGALAIGGALSSFGANQSMNLVPLNSYATQSLVGYNYNGMSQNQALQQLYSQVGATSGSQLSIGTGSLQDNLGFAQTLQQRAGSQNISQTAIGRATLGGAYAFGISNPNVTATTAAQMSAALYSPQFSYNAMSMGYRPLLSNTPGGKPLNAGGAAMSILQGMNLGKDTSQQLTSAFATGSTGYNNLTYLLQGTGIQNQQMVQYLTDYAQLVNNKGLTPTAATKLMTSAASGSSASMKAARNQLSGLGVSTANNDLASLTENQASVTGRSSTYINGFNQGLQDGAGLLTKFNNALTTLLGSTGLGTGLGQAGGLLGTITGGSGMGNALLGGAGIASLLGGDGSGGELGGGGGGSSLMRTILAGAGLGTAAYGAFKLATQSPAQKTATLKALGLTNPSNPLVRADKDTNNWISDAWNHTLGSLMHLSPSSIGGAMYNASPGGGASGASMGTSQQKTSGNSMNASVSGAARKAVSAAETQVGVPYQYGAELPGVGMDCSSLIQWAYKQAGVSLPRTSQQQWSALSKRSVPLDKVQEGDLVFMAGADGSGNSPGHVGMMINSRQLIQAPRTGEDVDIISYDPRSWQHAARPSGSGSFIAGTAGLGGRGYGNMGMGTGIGGNAYGSANEIDVISGMGYSSSGTRNVNGSSGASSTVTASTGTGSSTVPSSATKTAAIAKQILQKYGWSTGLQWQDFVKVENREAGWNLHAQNPSSNAYGMAQFINGPSEYYQYGGNPDTPQGQLTAMAAYIKCFPMDVKILTKRGYLDYKDVLVGDETPGLNLETDELEWTKILCTIKYEKAPLIRAHNSRFDTTCTPNHRWITEKLIQYPENYRITEFKDILSMGTRHRIKLAAIMDNDDGLPITDYEAEFLGWIHGDGSVGTYKVKHPIDEYSGKRLALYQSKIHMLPVIDTLLASIGMPVRKYVYPPKGWSKLPKHLWCFTPSYSQDFMRRTRYNNPVEAVILMSHSQRESFIRGLLLADGYQDKNGCWMLAQNEGIVLESAILAMYLTGHYAHKVNSGGQKHVQVSTAFIKPKGHLVIEDAGFGEVWCVETELGSWSAYQNGQVFLTGNSRYGNPAGAWANEQKLGWYSAGGTTLPGMAIVGERGPELMMQGGGAQVFSNAQTMQLINAIRGSSPAQSPWKTDITSGSTSSSSSSPVSINFSQGSIVIQSSGSSPQPVTSSGREVARQIIKHLNSEAVHQAIRKGEKM